MIHIAWRIIEGDKGDHHLLRKLKRLGKKGVSCLVQKCHDVKKR